MWYLEHEGLLDMSESGQLDYYLVLAGPPSATTSSRAVTWPWCIETVYLFDARQLPFDARQLRAGQIERAQSGASRPAS
jgi:hypothetical protein